VLILGNCCKNSVQTPSHQVPAEPRCAHATAARVAELVRRKGATSPRCYSHSGTTQYISFAIVYTKHTGSCDNHVNVYAQWPMRDVGFAGHD
jgi:hypothetical protein